MQACCAHLRQYGQRHLPCEHGKASMLAAKTQRRNSLFLAGVQGDSCAHIVLTLHCRTFDSKVAHVLARVRASNNTLAFLHQCSSTTACYSVTATRCCICKCSILLWPMDYAECLGGCTAWSARSGTSPSHEELRYHKHPTGPGPEPAIAACSTSIQQHCPCSYPPMLSTCVPMPVQADYAPMALSLPGVNSWRRS